MSAVELARIYYEMCLGYLPDKEEDIRRTEATIEYLIDNEYSEQEIKKTLLEVEASEVLSTSKLPDSLWQNSLIQRNKFYYHHELQITSAAPYYDPVLRKEIISPYFMEMKIRYTINDVYKYYIQKTLSPSINKNRDKGAIKKIVKDYSINGINGLDFILSLIDESRYTQDTILSIWDIQKNENIVYDKLLRNKAEAKAAGKDRIVWRP